MRVSLGEAAALEAIGAFSCDVFFKEKWDGAWEHIPYLEPILSHRKSLHGNTTARFRYRYANIKREDQVTFTKYEALDKRLFYCCVVVNPPVPMSKFCPFVGVVASDQLQVFGTAIDATSRIASGWQHITAHGLEFLLARRRLSSVPYRKDTEDPDVFREINTIPNFNLRPQRGQMTRGNRSGTKIQQDGPPTIPAVYGFSNAVNDSGSGHLWSFKDIIEFLLVWTDPPANWISDDEPHFTLSGQYQLLSFLDAHRAVVPIGNRDVLSILRQLIDKKRALSAYLHFNVDNADALPTTDDVKVYVVSMAEEPVTFGTITLPENPVQVDYTVDQAADVRHADIRITEQNTVDRVVVVGERMQVTLSAASDQTPQGQQPPFTLARSLNVAPLRKAWSATTEVAYKAAEDPARRFDQYDRVYRRFAIDTTSTSTEFTWQSMGQGEEPEDPDPSNILLPFIDNDAKLTIPVTKKSPYANMDVLGLPHLGLVAPADISAESLERRYNKAFALMQLLDVDGEGTNYWVSAEDPPPQGKRYADDTKSKAIPDVSAAVTVIERGMEIDINFRGAQHVLGKNHFDDASEKSRFSPVFDWQQMVVTLCFATEVRPACIAELNPSGSRALVIHVPNAHLWYIAPGTISGINESGHIVQATEGIARDDTALLRTTCAMAAGWYKKPRATLSYLRRRMLNPVQLGMFIRTVLTDAGLTNVGSVVTGIEHHYAAGTTKFSTGAIELDVRP